ncbi:hypothetical protein [Rossellomorea sp. FM04394]|uniref:hypothetical protein n=1 Tax=Rossellomorea sp. FM04394 TaxID=3243076 RepID=UPI0035A5F6A5
MRSLIITYDIRYYTTIMDIAWLTFAQPLKKKQTTRPNQTRRLSIMCLKQRLGVGLNLKQLIS